jgi:uncharacterized protein (DUF488 family)
VTVIYSIGHSNHDWSAFARLIGKAEIGAIADVRSNPASRLPHFNRSALRDRLNASGVSYLFMGIELGGRPTDGVPDYQAMAATSLFTEGIAQVEQIAARTRLALMCSEYEPLTCHRCLLIGRHLTERRADVAHILRDGTIEPYYVTEDRLLALTRLTNADLVSSRADRLGAAYRAQSIRITRSRR